MLPYSYWLPPLFQHRYLIAQLVEREVIGRYRGSFLGLLWSFVNPIIMLAIYTFVFSVVFKARWNSQHDDQFEFALVLFAGLIVFNVFSECLTRAPTLITSNVNYVKKVIFPLEILPIVALGSALFHALINTAVLFVFLIATAHPITLSCLYLPLIVAPLLLLIVGLSWFLASLGVFIRDITQFIGMSLTVIMFLSPIFYPASALPESIRDYLFLNPLTLIIEQMRSALIYGEAPDLIALGMYSLLALCCFILGFVWFKKTRKGFADVL